MTVVDKAAICWEKEEKIIQSHKFDETIWTFAFETPVKNRSASTGRRLKQLNFSDYNLFF